SRTDLHRIRTARVTPRRAQPVAVLLAVAEAQRIDTFDRRVGLFEAVVVQHQLQPPRRGQREMMLTLRANQLVLLQLRGLERGPATGAFGPYPGRDAAFFLGQVFVAVLSLVPGHRSLLGGAEPFEGSDDEARENNTSRARICARGGPRLVMLRACISGS